METSPAQLNLNVCLEKTLATVVWISLLLKSLCCSVLTPSFNIENANGILKGISEYYIYETHQFVSGGVHHV